MYLYVLGEGSFGSTFEGTLKKIHDVNFLRGKFIFTHPQPMEGERDINTHNRYRATFSFPPEATNLDDLDLI
jgi:hypothetical protein